MMTRRTARRARPPLLALLTALAAPLALPVPAAAQAAPLRGLDAYVERALREWNVPGVALAVVKDGEIIHAKGYGVKDVETGEPVDERTLFAIGSNSKSFTAAGLALLQDEGELDLDDRVTEHLPWFAVSDPFVTRELTLRDLLSHRSGLTRGDWAWYGMDHDREDALRRMRHQPMTTSLRSTFGYNNLMFMAAGEVIEEATGRSWDAFIDERFFGPLGMTASNTSVDPLAGAANVATPHGPSVDGPVPIAWRDIDNAGPAGSINSNVVEMTRWLEFLLGEGEVDGRRILSEEDFAELVTPHSIASGWSGGGMPVNFTLYGLGLALRDWRGELLVSHGGGIDGMTSQMAVLPGHDAGVVVLTNSESGLSDALTFRVIDQLLGGEVGDWAAVLLEQQREGERRAAAERRELEASRARGTRPSLALERYAGTYRHPMYGDVVVDAAGGRLSVRRGADFRGTLEHWHYDTFTVDWGGPQIGGASTWATFELDARGEAAAVAFTGLPPANWEQVVEFERVGEE